jgi:hypothetical protein
MKLAIKFNQGTEMWEVSEVSETEILWSGPLRREAFFYSRDREDDASDPVDDIVVFDRKGNITYGFLAEDNPL